MSRKRAAIYCRISRDRTGLKAGTQRQEHDCREHVERHGWELVEVFTDDDISAYSGKPRPKYAELLAAVKAGAIDVVVAWHPDRLTRSPRELEDLIDVLDVAGCTVSTVMAGAVDLSTRSGRTSARLVGVVARDESEAKAERLRAMHADKARKGEWPGGTRHYGYRPDDHGRLKVDQAEAAIIAECARRVLAGEPVNAVCVDLNRRGVPTVKGAQWRTQTLRRILTSHTVAGRREYKGEDVGEADWPAIIDSATWRRLRGVVLDDARYRPPVARVALLAGIARCSDCGAKLITQRRQTGRRVYACPATTRGGCGGIQIVADAVDDLVAEAVVAALDGPGLAEALANDRPSEVPAHDLDTIEAELAGVAADFGAGRISRREWLSARAPLEARREAAQARVAAEARTDALAPWAGREGALAAAWPTMTLDQQRAVVLAAVDRVTISRATRRGRGVDTERVAVEWAI